MIRETGTWVSDNVPEPIVPKIQQNAFLFGGEKTEVFHLSENTKRRIHANCKEAGNNLSASSKPKIPETYPLSGEIQTLLSNLGYTEGLFRDNFYFYADKRSKSIREEIAEIDSKIKNINEQLKVEHGDMVSLAKSPEKDKLLKRKEALRFDQSDLSELSQLRREIENELSLKQKTNPEKTILNNLRRVLNRYGLNIKLSDTPQSIKKAKNIVEFRKKIHGENANTQKMDLYLSKAQKAITELHLRNIITVMGGQLSSALEKAGSDLNDKYQIFDEGTGKIIGLDSDVFLLRPKEFAKALNHSTIKNEDGSFKNEDCESIFTKYIRQIYNNNEVKQLRKSLRN